MAISLTLYLDTRATHGDEPAPLKLCVNKRSRSAYLKTGISLRPSEWDAKARKVINHPHRKQLNDHLARIRLEIQDYLAPMLWGGELADATAQEIKDIIAEHINGRQKETPQVGVYWAQKTAQMTPPTAKIYNSTLRLINALYAGFSARQLHEINDDAARRIEALVSEKYAHNTRSTLIANIKTIFNNAREDGYIDRNPFAGMQTSYIAHHKRNLSVEQVRVLFAAVPKSPKQREALDLFRFSFYARALNPKDISMLTDESIFNGRIDTTRVKTGTPLSIKIEPELAEIIERRRDAARLFSPFARFDHYINCVISYNKLLKKTCEDNGLPPVSMYWARHTFASLLVELGYSMEIVAASLGHSLGRKITATYVTISDKQVDEAARAVFDYIKK